MVCPSFFPTSEDFEITEFKEFCKWKSRITDYRLTKSRVTADTEFTNHGCIFSVFPNHALTFCRIPNHAEPLPDPVVRPNTSPHKRIPYVKIAIINLTPTPSPPQKNLRHYYPSQCPPRASFSLFPSSWALYFSPLPIPILPEGRKRPLRRREKSFHFDAVSQTVFPPFPVKFDAGFPSPLGLQDTVPIPG